MELPNPIPDNPLRWDGWKLYASKNPYERLCLSVSDNPSSAEIEENCRRLLVWWQKKLPLKNQPSNPLSQLLRAGMDEAPGRLAEACASLLDPQTRQAIDAEVNAAGREAALAEFGKFLSFALTTGELAPDAEESLYIMGGSLGLDHAELKSLIDTELDTWGMKRVPKGVPSQVSLPSSPNSATDAAPAAQPGSASSPPQPHTGGVAPSASSPEQEFLRMLRLSGIDELTDDQRDAFCNMGEALGLSGGDAEDVIDLYLEERLAGSEATAVKAPVAKPAAPAPKVPIPAAAKPVEAPAQRPTPVAFSNSASVQTAEKRSFPPFTNTQGMPMVLIPSGSFLMGSNAPDASPNEQPVTRTNISAFYLARWPVTNGQYERFDPAHRAKRAPWADENHPVIYVSAIEAARYCAWLQSQEKRNYRLPTEAEWEYAARGTDERAFPWGQTLQFGDLANFADINKKVPWVNPMIDTGFSETSPVGSFPKGASPFGVEDLSGNVWEWCLDGLSTYSGKERTNPRGPLEGQKRIYRGGSWKSRISSLRASCRGFNSPEYSANDVGFRVMCEVR